MNPGPISVEHNPAPPEGLSEKRNLPPRKARGLQKAPPWPRAGLPKPAFSNRLQAEMRKLTVTGIRRLPPTAGAPRLRASAGTSGSGPRRKADIPSPRGKNRRRLHQQRKTEWRAKKTSTNANQGSPINVAKVSPAARKWVRAVKANRTPNQRSTRKSAPVSKIPHGEDQHALTCLLLPSQQAKPQKHVHQQRRPKEGSQTARNRGLGGFDQLTFRQRRDQQQFRQAAVTVFEQLPGRRQRARSAAAANTHRSRHVIARHEATRNSRCMTGHAVISRLRPPACRSRPPPATLPRRNSRDQGVGGNPGEKARQLQGGLLGSSPVSGRQRRFRPGGTPATDGKKASPRGSPCGWHRFCCYAGDPRGRAGFLPLRKI